MYSAAIAEARAGEAFARGGYCSALEATALGKRYGARAVLRQLTFRVTTGTVAAVVGPNGAGKSTLLKIVASLTAPSRGAVQWREIGAASEGERVSSGVSLGRHCGLSAPDAPLPRELTAYENLEFLSQLRGLRLTAEGLLQHLRAWGLQGREHSLCGDLSSGLCARLQLAAATLHGPRILLLDEPSANLDESGRALLRAALLRQRSRGIVLLATNDPHEAALCDICIDVAAKPLATEPPKAVPTAGAPADAEKL